MKKKGSKVDFYIPLWYSGNAMLSSGKVLQKYVLVSDFQYNIDVSEVTCLSFEYIVYFQEKSF